MYLGNGLMLSIGTENIIDLCESYGWKFIIRYKEGSAKSIKEEYQAIKEKEKTETKEFKWVTNFEIKKKNAVKIAVAGCLRWKIENEGFNRQKHWQGNLEHACSWNTQAQKNHYLMEQIADFMRQLYEYFYLKKNGIEKL